MARWHPWLNGQWSQDNGVWMNSGSWWWKGRPGMLQFMGSQRVGHYWLTELNWTEHYQKVYSWDLVVVCAKSLQSCPTLSDPMDCSPLGSSVQGILQARILEWVAISFSRGSSQRRDWIWSPALLVDSLPLSHLGSPHLVTTPCFFVFKWGVCLSQLQLAG